MNLELVKAQPGMSFAHLELDEFPSELLILQALALDLASISKVCQASRRFNEVICNNEWFWHQKFIQDFDFDPVLYTGSWKQLYEQYGSIWVMGNNEYGQLGLGDDNNRSSPTLIPNTKARQVSSGARHTVLIDLQDNILMMGNNRFGQLGLGDRNNRLSPTLLPNIKARQVSAGRHSTVLIGTLIR